MSGKTIALAATSLEVGGIGSYLRDVAAGLGGRGWRVHLVLTDDGRGLAGGLPPLAGAHDLSGTPRSAAKVRAVAALVTRIDPAVLLLNHAALLHYALPLLPRAVLPVAVVHSDDPRYHRTAALFAGRVFRWVAPTPGAALGLVPLLRRDEVRRLRVVPHGIPAGLFEARAGRGRGDGGRPAPPHRVVFAGFVAPNKGADLLPAIMRRVWERAPQARLTVVGGGPLLEGLRGDLRAAGGEGKCEFTGAVGREDAAAVLREADVLLAPTRLEGFGLAIAEAMLGGAVPVATRLPGVTDFVVEHERTGLLVDRDDVAGFAEAVCGLLLDPVRQGALAAAAVAEARRRFSMDGMLDAVEKICAEKDDRPRLPQRGRIGWAVETAVEVTRRGASPGWVRRRIGEHFSTEKIST